MPVRTPPRDIPAAMARGLSNQEIEQLIAKSVLPRPRSPADAPLWPVGSWEEAMRRGLVW